jgi:hypothetical protein
MADFLGFVRHYFTKPNFSPTSAQLEHVFRKVISDSTVDVQHSPIIQYFYRATYHSRFARLSSYHMNLVPNASRSVIRFAYFAAAVHR